jgi:uncharacterized pyridoxamine 5'-phosphate oxidase family protein
LKQAESLSKPVFKPLHSYQKVEIGLGRTFGEWLRFAGRDHFHHRLSDLGIGNLKTVLVIYLVSI